MGELDSEAVQCANCGSSVGDTGLGVAPLVVLDASGCPLEQRLAVGRFEVPTLDQCIRHDAHLADGPLGIFFSAVADKSWLETDD